MQHIRQIIVRCAFAAFIPIGVSTPFAAAAAASTHYQKMVTLSCSNNVCSGDFAGPRRGSLLTLTRMSCYIQSVEGTTPSTLELAYLKLNAAPSASLMTNLTSIHTDAKGWFHTTNDAIDLQVLPRQSVTAYLVLEGEQVDNAYCAGFGTLETP